MEHRIRPRQLDNYLEQSDMYHKAVQTLERMACWALDIEGTAYGEVRNPEMKATQAKVAMFLINKFIPDESMRRALELQENTQRLNLDSIKEKFRKLIADDPRSIQNLIGDDYVIVPKEEYKQLETRH